MLDQSLLCAGLSSLITASPNVITRKAEDPAKIGRAWAGRGNCDRGPASSVKVLGQRTIVDSVVVRTDGPDSLCPRVRSQRRTNSTVRAFLSLPKPARRSRVHRARRKRENTDSLVLKLASIRNPD